MNNQQKGFLKIAVLIVLLIIVVGGVSYFLIQKSTGPSNVQLQVQKGAVQKGAPIQFPISEPQQQSQQTKIVNWAEYRWGSLKFRYPDNWKIEVTRTSIILTPPAKTSFFITQVAFAESEDRIVIESGRSCPELGLKYRCQTIYGLSTFTASNNQEVITVFDEVVNSATLVITARDSKTGIKVKATYIMNGKKYTEEELNSYLKKAPRGRYDITVKAAGYKEMSSYIQLPVSVISKFQFMMNPYAEPIEFSDDYLKQYAKPGTGLIIGFVVDEDGQPLSGVNVISPTYRAITNERGFYALNAVLPEEKSCEGIDITFSKPGYKTEKHLHAMSGSVIPSSGGVLNVTLQKGSGENITDDKHKLCE